MNAERDEKQDGKHITGARSLTRAERNRVQAYFRIRDALAKPVPADYSIARAVCDRWERDPQRKAMLDLTGSAPNWLSFRHFGIQSRKFANALRALGVQFADRVAIGLPQGPAAATAHLAVYRLGAIAVPVSVVHGSEAIGYRLTSSHPRVARKSGRALQTILTCGNCVAGSSPTRAVRLPAHGRLTMR